LFLRTESGTFLTSTTLLELGGLPGIGLSVLLSSSSEEAIERVNANESNLLDSSWSPAAESGREAVRDAIRI